MFCDENQIKREITSGPFCCNDVSFRLFCVIFNTILNAQEKTNEIT